MGLLLIFIIVLTLAYGCVILISGFKYRSAKERLQQFGIALVITVVFFSMIFMKALCDDYQWNEGICSSCGGNYEFVTGVGHRVSTTYIYQCTNCGEKTQLSVLM